MFSPVINEKSREIDQTHIQGTGLKRTDLMHEYAELYSHHKDLLRDAYQEKEVDQLKFEPQLNPNSLRIVQESAKTFNDRALDHYLNKSQRVDRDPNQIEFEK